MPEVRFRKKDAGFEAGILMSIADMKAFIKKAEKEGVNPKEKKLMFPTDVTGSIGKILKMLDGEVVEIDGEMIAVNCPHNKRPKEKQYKKDFGKIQYNFGMKGPRGGVNIIEKLFEFPDKDKFLEMVNNHLENSFDEDSVMKPQCYFLDAMFNDEPAGVPWYYSTATGRLTGKGRDSINIDAACKAAD